MFYFTPLLGAQCASPASQSLLELDGGIKILVDVGWDETFDADKLKALEVHVSTLSVILLTHPTIDHIGAYAHCCKHVPLFNEIPVYATIPVINLGRTLLLDLYDSAPEAAAIVSGLATGVANGDETALDKFLFEPPSHEEVASYFTRIHPLKYSQPHQPISSPFSPPLSNLTVTAYGAGHTLGGTMWHIQHGLESIVYATDWNQGRENLLPGASWLTSAAGSAEIIEPLRRPTALVCSTHGMQKANPISRRRRDDVLLSLIRERITQGGSVLLPIDSSARVLELAFLLDSTWREGLEGPDSEIYKGAKIYMAGKSSSAVVRNVQSMLEWVDDAVRVVAEAAETSTVRKADVESPLSWKYVKRIEKQSHLERVLSRPGPKIILASDPTLQWGFSRLVLEKLGSDGRNLVILTDRAVEVSHGLTSLGSQLWQFWEHNGDSGLAQAGTKIVQTKGQRFRTHKVIPMTLSAADNIAYQQHFARRRQMQSSSQDPTTIDMADDQASDSSDSEDEGEEDEERQGRALNVSAQLISSKKKTGYSESELGVNVLLRSQSVYDYDVRNKRGREKVFPYVAHRQKQDEFGVLIKPEDFLRAEERDAVEADDVRGSLKQETGIGQKRKWADAARQAGKKVRTIRQEPDDIDAAIARATGEAAEEDSSGSEESDYEPQGPVDWRKVLVVEEQVATEISVAYVDFSGIHERRDLQMLIPLIRPRNLILVSGQQEETQSLADECRLLLQGEASTDVFTPAQGEIVDASVDTNAWSVKLSRPLVKRLTWQNVKGLGIVALTGRLSVESLPPNGSKADEIVPKKPKTEVPKTTTEADHTVPMLDLVAGALHQQIITQPVHVGDLRLTALRQLVTASGHTAEFRGEGTLLVDGTVVVKKGRHGSIEVEAGPGGLSAPQFRTRETDGSFFAVRKLIYDGLAVVAGA